MRHETFSIRSHGIELAGEVFVPPAAVGGVVLIGGSGPTERSNDGYFVAHQQVLVSHGLAVAWYDKRGVGASSGDYLEGGLDELALDARSAHALLQGHLTGRPVGLLGHSEGGWVALRAARDRPEIAFVVTTSTPPMTPADQDDYAVDQWLASQGLSPSNLIAARALYVDLQALAAADAEFVFAAELLDRSTVSPLLRPALGRFDEREWAFWKRERSHDPLLDHAVLGSPHLAVFGLDDALLPAAEAASAFAQAAVSGTRAPAATVTAHLVPQADHRLRIPPDDKPSSDLLDLICAWIVAAPSPVFPYQSRRRAH